MTLGDRLPREGYAVDSVRDGESAFRNATSDAFDRIILDIMPPNRSGLDVCCGVRVGGSIPQFFSHDPKWDCG